MTLPLTAVLKGLSFSLLVSFYGYAGALDAPAVEVMVENPQMYASGDEAAFKFTLLNRSGRPVVVTSRGGEEDRRIEAAGGDKSGLKATNKYWVRRSIRRATIDAGASYDGWCNLSSYYRFDKPGTYQFRFFIRLFEAKATASPDYYAPGTAFEVASPVFQVRVAAASKQPSALPQSESNRARESAQFKAAETLWKLPPIITALRWVAGVGGSFAILGAVWEIVRRRRAGRFFTKTVSKRIAPTNESKDPEL